MVVALLYPYITRTWSGVCILKLTLLSLLVLPPYYKEKKDLKKERKKEKKKLFYIFKYPAFPLPPLSLETTANFHSQHYLKPPLSMPQISAMLLIQYSVLTFQLTWSHLTQLITFSFRCLLPMTFSKPVSSSFPLINYLHILMFFLILSHLPRLYDHCVYGSFLAAFVPLMIVDHVDHSDSPDA